MSKALLVRFTFLAAATMAWTGCTVKGTTIPDLAGPSGFANPVAITATPDNITEDGSQSVVVATVLKPDGSPAANVAVKLAIYVNGAQVEYGTLNARTVYTDANGRAATIYTAPTASPFFYGGPSKLVQVKATTIGSNYDVSGEATEQVSIKLTPPPMTSQNGGPQASVTYAPLSPKVGENITFDASASTAGVAYFWDFGDGREHDEHGSDASHAYSSAGTYTMVVGVTDASGRISSAFRTIVVK